MINLLIAINTFTSNEVHAEHTKRSIIYTQILRVNRVCSQESDFKKHSSKLKSWFLKRRYPQKTIDTEIKNVLGDSSRKINNKILFRGHISP